MLADRILVSGSPEQMAGWDVQPLYFTCPSLSSDDRRLYLISARRGHPNVYVRDLETGKETRLTDNRAGILKSYVYFDGTPGRASEKPAYALTASATPSTSTAVTVSS